MSQAGLQALKTFQPSGGERKHLAPTDATPPVSEKTPTSCESHPKKTINITVVKIIGQGSFGTVYQGNDENGATVAVKTVLQDPRYKNREYKIMKLLNHPFVIKMKNCFYTHTDKKELFLNIVMDFYPESLYSFIRSLYKTQRSLSDIYVKLYFYQMMRSLLYIHLLGVTHRDIKPQNILIDPVTHHSLLCDFGSAKALVPGDSNVSYICSRYYRAPELIFNAVDYTCAIDVWSMGCVFVEMMTGKPLFPGETSTDQLIEIIKVLGTPRHEDINEMNSSYTDFSLPDIKAVPWTTTIHRSLSPEIMDLLSKIFVYKPKQRITALEALMHPYFDELRSPTFSLPRDEPFPELRLKRDVLEVLIPPHARTPAIWPQEYFARKVSPVASSSAKPAMSARKTPLKEVVASVSDEKKSSVAEAEEEEAVPEAEQE